MLNKFVKIESSLENINSETECHWITKRDGRRVRWDSQRIEQAARKAIASVRSNAEWELILDFGLNESQIRLAAQVAIIVEQRLWYALREEVAPKVEEIQNLVEEVFMELGEREIAKAFILYRAQRAQLRINSYKENGLQDYIVLAKYSRFRPEWGRREVWPEPVDRVRAMHLKRFAWVDQIPWLPVFQQKNFSQQITDAFKSVQSKEILPSMRSLQFGGDAIEQEESRMFNCAFTFVNRIEAFSETMWLLLCGTGTGFSVQTHHIQQLPGLPPRSFDDDLPIKHYAIKDHIAGWSDAVAELIRSHYDGQYIEFDYSQIRPKGSALKTSGGRAPGHLPLKRTLDAIRLILQKSQGRQLKSIEAYDILMFCAKAVLSGGIRRSATICLFSADDEEMMCSKTGNWFATDAHRSASNNSAVIHRGKTPKDVFLKLFEKQKEFGEPGFYFVDHEDYGANPCVEIGLAPFAKIESEDDLIKLKNLGFSKNIALGDKVYGWQMCNLTTINAAACETDQQFFRLCRDASLIGTLQAHYTHMPYLGPVTEFINQRESLLGVSITGILDNPRIFLNPIVLEKGANIVREENVRVSSLIGISPAARTTCVKPEGTASLLLGTSSGIHPRHAKRYFRRVQANRQEPVYQHFRSINPHMTERSVYNPNDDVILFPVQSHPETITRDDVDAITFLEYVKCVQKHWVIPGCAHQKYNPGLQHNVSNTCIVRENEWDEVREYIWENRKYFTGISLLSYVGDKIYPQAPHETVVSESDISRWNTLKYKKVDYTALNEHEDQTNLKETAACAGGQCDLTLSSDHSVR